MTSHSQEKSTNKVERVWLLEPEQTGPFPAVAQPLQEQRQKVTEGSKLLNFSEKHHQVEKQNVFL